MDLKKEAERLVNILHEQIKQQLDYECSSYIFYIQALINEYNDRLTQSEQLILQRTTKIYRQVKRGHQIQRIDLDQLNAALVVVKRRFIIKSFV